MTLRYRLDGFDTGDVTRHRQLDLVKTGRDWLITKDRPRPRSDVSTARDLWEFGPVSVVTGRHSLVFGRQRPGELRRLARGADDAVDRVAAGWPRSWAERVVVLAPRDVAEMGAVLGAGPAGSAGPAGPVSPPDLRQVAAVTTGHVGGPRADQVAGSVDRVVLNPETFPALSPLGRSVVLAHEVAHVATRAATPPGFPLWLSEGFADHVGYRGTGVPPAVAASGVLAAARRDASTLELPADDAFGGSASDISRAYEGSWLACRLIAERWGEQVLQRFYVVAGQRGGGLDVAFRDVLGRTPGQFEADWRDYLARLAA